MTLAPTRPAPPRPRRRLRAVDPIPWWLRLVTVVVALYFVLPTLFVIPMSFGSAGSFQFPPKQFSLDLYVNFFTNPKWIGSLGNSLVVAVLASILATIVGTAAALALNNMTGRLSQFVRTLLMISMVTPAIVMSSVATR